MATKHIDMATFEELKKMSGADFIRELIDTFLDEAPKLIAELKSALKQGDTESFRRAAHSLKSNGATFGATEFSAQAKELELMGRENRLGQAGDRIRALEKALGDVAAELKGLRA